MELVVREVPGWAGLLALAALPLRFAEAHFANRLAQLGEGASSHLGYLTALSTLVTLALLPALWGRALFTRAAARRLAGRAGPSGPSGSAGALPLSQELRLPLAGFAAYLYTAAWAELIFLGLGWTLVALPLAALVSGLAAVISPGGPGGERPGLLASMAELVKKAPPAGVLVGLAFVFTLAVIVAFVNVYFAFQLGLWLAGAVPGIDLSWWTVALSFDNRLFVAFVAVIAVTLVEPFWLAALVAATAAARSRQTGEDLRARFAELTATEKAP